MGRVEPGFLRQVLNLGGRSLDYLAKRAALDRYYTCGMVVKERLQYNATLCPQHFQHQDWRVRFPITNSS